MIDSTVPRYDVKLELAGRMGVTAAVTYGLKSIVSLATKGLNCFRAITPIAGTLSNSTAVVVRTTKSIFQDAIACLTSPNAPVTEAITFNYPLAAGLLTCAVVDTAANFHVPDSSIKKELVRQIAGIGTTLAIADLQGVLAYEMYRALFATCRLGYEFLRCKKNEISKSKIV